MIIKELKKKYNLKDKDIATFFKLSRESYCNSSAKKRYENALILFAKHIEAINIKQP